jgi:hypothetical protein
MSARRASGRRSGPAEWSHPTRRRELLQAIGVAAAVVLGTALVIFLIKPGDSSSSTPTPVQQTPASTVPASDSGANGSTGGTGSTGAPPTSATTPASTTATTAPAP